MKKLIGIALAGMIVLSGLASAEARDKELFGHKRGHLDFGLTLGPGWWGPGFWGPSPAYPFYPYYPEPEARVQESSGPGSQPAAQSPYPWYFCPERQGYYPYVKDCPRSWIKVAPPLLPMEYGGATAPPSR